MYFDQIEFEKRLAGLRKVMGLSQEAMAEKLNISKVHYGNLERGTAGCSIDLLIAMSCVFHVSTDYLLMGKETSKEYDLKQLLSVISQLTEIAQNM